MKKIFTRRGKCDVYLCDDYNELNTFLIYTSNYEDIEFGFSNIPLNNGENIKWVEFDGKRVGKIWPHRQIVEVYHGTVFEEYFNKYDRATAEDFFERNWGKKTSDSSTT